MIIRKKQGQGKPTKIYVCNFTKEIIVTAQNQTYSENKKQEVQTPENRKSDNSVSSENIQTEVKTLQNGKSKLPKTGSPYILCLNHTEINHTNLSIYLSIKNIKQNKHLRKMDGRMKKSKNVKNT